jgi:PTS system glucitol/sorbitol-specific IIA component
MSEVFKMKILYDATIAEIGADVPMIIEENMLIFFDHKAPKELHDIAVVHKDGSLTDEIGAGDKLVLGSSEFSILFVGDAANSTLREMGHFTVNFSGDLTETLPGSIYVNASSVPDVTPGMPLRFLRD